MLYGTIYNVNPQMESVKLIKLSLSAEPFEQTCSGIKREEYREDTPWIRSRLIDAGGRMKTFDAVKYYHGPHLSEKYSTCTVEYRGVQRSVGVLLFGEYVFPVRSWIIHHGNVMETSIKENKVYNII